MYDSGDNSERDDDGNGNVNSNEVYKESAELVLVLLSDLYSLLESILVYISGPSFYLILHFLLIIYSTNYCFKESKLFWSKKTILL